MQSKQFHYTICRDILSYVSQAMISKLMIDKKKPVINPLTVKKKNQRTRNEQYVLRIVASFSSRLSAFLLYLNVDTLFVKLSNRKCDKIAN